MREIIKALPDEPCYWIREQVVQAPLTGVAVRVQTVVVNRDGDLAMVTEPLEGDTDVPPIEYEVNGTQSVAKARDIIESIRKRERSDPPGLTIEIGGETYVEADHPALEEIEYGEPDGPYTSYRSRKADPSATVP